MSVMVETMHLAKSFGPITAVDDLTLSVRKGEVLGFLGPNGAGKSTAMKILTCFLHPDSGTAEICGHDILEHPRAVREAVGYLPETAPAYAEMTVQGFLEFVGQIRGMRGTQLAAAVDEVTEKCHLESVRRQPFETLSKGFKRRTCLAQALIHDPPVLIMDEPTDGLDPNQKHEVRRLISAMAEDKCIVLSTHILEEVDAVCSRAVIIDQGRLVADCSPQELREKSPRHGAVVLLLRGVEEALVKGELEKLEGVKQVEAFEREGRQTLEIFPEPGMRIAPRVTDLVHDRAWTVEEIHIEHGQLDEVFRNLTSDGGTTS
jgi:ABC-2 type transport system ATP-binding protein